MARDDLHSFASSYALRAQVEHANLARLSGLQGDIQTYQAHDIPGVDIIGRLVDSQRATALADQTLAVRELPLKLGAQVMLIMVCRVCVRKSAEDLSNPDLLSLTEPGQDVLFSCQWIVGDHQGLCNYTRSAEAGLALP